MALVQKLNELYRLYMHGGLTADEFTQAKAATISGIPQAEIRIEASSQALAGPKRVVQAIAVPVATPTKGAPSVQRPPRPTVGGLGTASAVEGAELRALREAYRQAAGLMVRISRTFNNNRSLRVRAPHARGARLRESGLPICTAVHTV